MPITGSSWLLICISGMASSLFCAAAVAESRGWIPTSIGSPSDNAAPLWSAVAPVGPAAAKAQEELAILIRWHRYARHAIGFVHVVTFARAADEGGQVS
jgi:hypothetical protein